VTKPVIPAAIQHAYETMEGEKTKLLIATQVQKVVEKEAETESRRAAIEANKIAAVSEINMQKEIAEKESLQKISLIQDAMHLQREKTLADAEHYRALKEAEANSLRLTDAFLQYTQIRSLSNTTKIYFGEKLPSVFMDRQD
jgi:hypothetical protein